MLHRLLGWRTSMHSYGLRAFQTLRSRSGQPRAHFHDADSKARSRRRFKRREVARAAGRRRRMRGLQPLRAGLSGRELHHYAARGKSFASEDLGRFGAGEKLTMALLIKNGTVVSAEKTF